MGRVLLITEKPGVSEYVLQGLKDAVLHDKDVDMVFIYPISWWEWKIPSKTPLRKIPSTPQPKDMQLKLHSMMDTVPYGQITHHGEPEFVLKRNGSTISDFRKTLIDRWNSYDKVICIPEDDRNGWGSLIRWFKWLSEVNESILIGKDIRCLKPAEFSAEAVKEAYTNAISLGSEYIGEMSRQFEFKHMFDAWYNLNSATVFGIAQRKANVRSPGIITKYELMTIHAIHKGQHLDLKSHDVLQGMEKWCGSGAYKAKLCKDDLEIGKGKFACLAFQDIEHRREAPYDFLEVGIGTSASRERILEKLFEKDLISEDDNEVIQITERGEAFIRKCHYGTFDPDLPFRIERWVRNNDVEAVKRYIRRYFSRQKRFVI